MNTIIRSAIFYFEIILLLANSFSLIFPCKNYNGSANQKNIPVIKQWEFFNDSVAIKDNSEVLQKRTQQFKSDDLFLVNHPVNSIKLDFIVVKHVKVLVAFRTPDYLLSSDLKSPPYIS